MPPRSVTYLGGPAGTIDGILKDDHVIAEIVDQVNRATFLWSQLTQEKTNAGRQFMFSTQFGVGEGQGNRPEDVDLPDEGFGEYEQPRGQTVYQYGALRITGQAMAATEGRRAAYVSVLKQALKDCRDGFKLNTQRQSHGDGSGTVALVEDGVTAGVTIPVTSPFGLSYVAGDLDGSQRVRLFRRRQRILFETAGEVRTITGIDPANGTITVHAPVTVVAGDRIIRGDSPSLNSDGVELTGLAAVVRSSGTYMAVPRAGIPEWQGNEIEVGTGSGGPISEELIQLALDTTEIYGNGATPNLMLTDHKTRRRFLSLLQAYKRFVNPMELEGGFDALEYNGKPMVVDRDSAPQRIYFLNTADWYRMVMRDVGWLDQDGRVLRFVDKRDVWRAYLAAYWELLCKSPANQTVLYNIVGGN